MKKILVVDDDQDVLYLTQHILTSRGYEVYIESTGLKVPELVMNYSPDLILLDVLLPEKSGVEICKKLKQRYTVPVILISAHSEHRESLKVSKADAFISKPFDTEQLINTINLHLK